MEQQQQWIDHIQLLCCSRGGHIIRACRGLTMLKMVGASGPAHHADECDKRRAVRRHRRRRSLRAVEKSIKKSIMSDDRTISHQCAGQFPPRGNRAAADEETKRGEAHSIPGHCIRGVPISKSCQGCAATDRRDMEVIMRLLREVLAMRGYLSGCRAPLGLLAGAAGAASGLPALSDPLVGLEATTAASPSLAMVAGSPRSASFAAALPSVARGSCTSASSTLSDSSCSTHSRPLSADSWPRENPATPPTN